MELYNKSVYLLTYLLTYFMQWYRHQHTGTKSLTFTTRYLTVMPC